MTEQIVIKLNEKKFKPLLDAFIQNGHGLCKSYSECVEKILFFHYLHATKKVEQLDNMSEREFVSKAKKVPPAESMMNFLKEFEEYLKTGKLP